ncbi:MAG: universal stress protein [Anaerolineales bacterium]
MFKRILVPLDGSNLAEKVLPLACYLAKMLQATLILFHVVEKDAPNEIHGQHHLQGVEEAQAYLDQLAIKLSSADLSILQDIHNVQDDGVAQTIHDHARELNADMIILCAHGKSGLRGMLFGSIAEQVIRQGTIPVLFIRPDSMSDIEVRPIRQILLPLDGVKSHEAAIPIAVFLAAKSKAKLRLLTVVPTPQTLPFKEAITGRYIPNATSLSLDISAQQADNYLHMISRDLVAKEISVSGMVLRGDVTSRLVEMITTENIDLIVMATHSHVGLNARWVSSLTPNLLSKTPIPVMLVHVSEESAV